MVLNRVEMCGVGERFSEDCASALPEELRDMRDRRVVEETHLIEAGEGERQSIGERKWRDVAVVVLDGRLNGGRWGASAHERLWMRARLRSDVLQVAWRARCGALGP